MESTTATINDGLVVIPVELRDRYGLANGTVIVIEAGENGIVIRPLDDPEIEIYTPERIAEFLLNNAVDAEDYRRAEEEVRRLGFEPDQILHDPPPS